MTFVGIPSRLSTICWKDYSFHLLNWLKTNWPSVWGFISTPSIMFHWSMSIPCPYHTVFITVTFSYDSKSGSLSSLTSLFVSKIVLAILQPLHFQMNFKIRFTISGKKKKSQLEFWWAFIELTDQSGENLHLNNIEYSNPWILNVSSLIYIFFSFLPCFIIFSTQTWPSFVKFTSRFVIPFCCCEWNCLLKFYFQIVHW